MDNFKNLRDSNGWTPQVVPLDGGVSIIEVFWVMFHLNEEKTDLYNARLGPLWSSQKLTSCLNGHFKHHKAQLLHLLVSSEQ